MNFLIRHLPALALTLGLASPAFAFNCAPHEPLLTARLVDNVIADVTVVDHISFEVTDPDRPTSERNLDAVTVSISHVYQGEITDTGMVPVIGSLPWCTLPITSLPVGARYIVALQPSAYGPLEIVFGTRGLEVIGANVLGDIRDFGCAVPEACGSEPETMPLKEFGSLQEAYFAGARSGVHHEALHTPAFSFDNYSLKLPRVRLYQNAADIYTNKSPMGVVEATLRLLSGENGNLVFSVESLSSN